MILVMVTVMGMLKVMIKDNDGDEMNGCASLGGETYSHWTQKPHDDEPRIPALDMKPACENFIYAQRTP